MQNLYDLIKDKPQHRQFKISDVLFTEYKCPETRSVFEVWSHLNYFVYVISGQMKWETQRSEYLIRSGDSILVKKGANTVHKFFEEQFCSLIVFVPDAFVRTVIREAPVELPAGPGEKGDSVLPLRPTQRLDAFFPSLFAYFFEKEAPPRPLLKMKFKELILTLACSPENAGVREYFRTLCRGGKLSLREVMADNFTYNLTLGEFARLSGRSLSTFKRDFIECFGIPPGRWLRRRRLAYSRRLLLSTDQPVSEVAHRSGFANVSHFIRVFRESYGLTPLQFRKEQAGMGEKDWSDG